MSNYYNKTATPTTNMNYTERTKTSRKSGRTLLVKTPDNTFDEQLLNSLSGLVNKTDSKASKSYFLTFDTITNAEIAYTKLRTTTDYRVKYSYYRAFFIMNGLTDTSDYNDVKKEMTDYVYNNFSTNVLYCKFYRKDNKYLGCGDLTVDTLDSLSALLSKDKETTEHLFGKFSVTFYRFNNRKDKDTITEA
jgi:hypothetical protein